MRQLRPRADQRHRLRAGVDPAHDRRADDPHRRHPAAPPRQHGQAGRRHHGDAGPLHHPGLDRSGDAVRRAAGLPAAAVRRGAPRDPRLLCRARGPAHRILGQLPQVRRQPAQGLVRRRRHAGERLRLLLAAARGRRLFAAALLRSHVQGRGQGLFPLRAESRRGRAERAPASRGTAQPRLAGGARLVRDRERRVLEGRPGRSPARRHQDRSVLHPGRRRAGEGGQPHQHPADAPVARQGARPAGRQPLRRLVPLQPRQAPQAALRRLDRSQGPGPAPPHLGLRARPAGTAARRQPQPDRGRAGPREGAHGDQRVPAGRDGSSHRPAAAGVGILRAGGGRHDLVRVLDLQRSVPRAGAQPRQGAEAQRPTRSTPSGASPGRTTAASSTTAHRRTPRGDRGRSERSWSGGTRDRAGGSAPTSRTSIPSCLRTTARRPAPRE